MEFEEYYRDCTEVIKTGNLEQVQKMIDMNAEVITECVFEAVDEDVDMIYRQDVLSRLAYLQNDRRDLFRRKERIVEEEI